MPAATRPPCLRQRGRGLVPAGQEAQRTRPGHGGHELRRRRSARHGRHRQRPARSSRQRRIRAEGRRRPRVPAGGHSPTLTHRPLRWTTRDLDLVDTLRSTGAARQFHPDPVPDHVLARLLDTARFAPSGGNRQGWRVIVVKDPVTRIALRDLYLSGWYEYLAMVTAGLVPWAPVTDREAEGAADQRRGVRRRRRGSTGLRRDARDGARPPAGARRPVRTRRRSTRLPRYTFAGGASIYPFVWSLLLAARAEGLGGVMTTMPVRSEDGVRALFAIPDTVAVAALVVLGPSRLPAPQADSGPRVRVHLGRPLRRRPPHRLVVRPRATRRFGARHPCRGQMGHGAERPR